ncbi:MAG TPA: methyltransferase domain-containing protein [Candidatus Eisenbacteria bacterium]
MIPSDEDTREEVKRRFGDAAERYVRSADHAQGESLDRLIEIVRPQPDWRVLDVATGGGHTALALSPLVREVVATDLTVAMLEAAARFFHERGATNIRVAEADALDLPFEDASFDLVTCRIAPHHFPDCARFVREAARVVRPGGLVAVIDNVVPDDEEAAAFINALEKRRDPSHHWAYTEREWLAFFRDAGLAIVHAESFWKARDFDTWMDRMSVDASTRAVLLAMLRSATGKARESLDPSEGQGRVRLRLAEVLAVGCRGRSS